MVAMPHIDTGAFDAEVTKAMSAAFAEVCATLKIGTHCERDREIIAMRILELARKGVTSAPALRDRVLTDAQLRF